MPTLEERVARLEAEVKKLSQKGAEQDSSQGNNLWVNRVFGMFKDDPLFDAAVAAGAAYRKAQVPDYMKEDDVSS